MKCLICKVEYGATIEMGGKCRQCWEMKKTEEVENYDKRKTDKNKENKEKAVIRK